MSTEGKEYINRPNGYNSDRIYAYLSSRAATKAPSLSAIILSNRRINSTGSAGKETKDR